jgi:septum formation protein
MRLFGQPFVVHPADVDETLPEEVYHPTRLAKQLAYAKAQAVAPHYMNALMIAADTLVVLPGKTSATVLGKPEDEEDAKRMLRMLSGRSHIVITAVCLMQRIENQTTRFTLDAPRTQVHFRPLTDPWIDWYVRTGEPMDKAGAYGIQEYGALLVERINGCYFNVVGFPLTTVSRRLEEFGWQPVPIVSPHAFV